MKLQDFDFRIWDKERKIFLEKQKIDSAADDKIIAAGILHFLGKNSYLGFGEVWEHKHKHQKEQTIIGFNFGDETTQNLEIELYTGLKDKNGIKIFEGDIIAAQFTKKTQFGKKGTQYKVKFRYGGFHITNVPNKTHTLNLSTIMEFISKNRYVKCIIIGNIHKNPELIEQKRKDK